jgi:hypothetical protein
MVLPALDDDEPVGVPPPTGEVVEIHHDELDPAPDVALDPGRTVTLGSGQPLACMFQVDCLMEQVETASSSRPPEVAPPVMPPDTGPIQLPPAA